MRDDPHGTHGANRERNLPSYAALTGNTQPERGLAPAMTIEADQERECPSWPFVIECGADAINRLHRWLDEQKAAGVIGPWYDVGSKTDSRGTLAFVEFEREGDGLRAGAAWERAK